MITNNDNKNHDNNNNFYNFKSNNVVIIPIGITSFGITPLESELFLVKSVSDSNGIIPLELLSDNMKTIHIPRK